MPKLAFPKRHKHADVRSRAYLTEAEVERLRRAARGMGTYGHRNDTMILLGYRHGFRISELIHLRGDQMDLDQGLLHVRRLKHGVPSTHPLTGTEIRALRKLQRQVHGSVYVFVSQRKGPLTDPMARKIIVQAGELAGLRVPGASASIAAWGGV